jgi:hypothetical protein
MQSQNLLNIGPTVLIRSPDWVRPGATNTYLAGGDLGRFLALLKTLVLSAFPFTFGKHTATF